MLYSVFRQMVRLPESIQTRISWLAARKPAYSYVTGLALTLTVVVAGCATAPDKVVVEPSQSPEPVELPKQTPPPAALDPTTKDESVEAQPDNSDAAQKQPESAGDMVTVSVYTIDDQCNDFVAQPMQVPSDAPMREAVGKVMSETPLNAFKLDGYQVSLDGNTAVVDLRLAPGSERQFVSLSSCEQRSLFGGVEETLLNNDSWGVDSVKFTNSGKELML
ncbi:MAG: hypothetical protein WA984_16630 [Phormidesmis sp.]